MSHPRISVVIPTHNRPAQLRETLSAMGRQTPAAGDIEVIVVDDGSSPPVVFAPESEGPAIVLLRLEGLGRSAARNAGAARAAGDLLVFVDDDVIVRAGFLQAHHDAHCEWPGVIATGRLILAGADVFSPFAQFRRALEDSCLPDRAGPVELPNFCAAGNMSIARSTFESLGGFNPAMSSGEDQDLALRQTARGGQLVFVPEAEGLHRDRAMNLSAYCRRHESGSAALIPFMRRHPDWRDNLERARSWGPIRWGQEPASVSLRKALKRALQTGPLRTALLAGVTVLERVSPRSRCLGGLYRLLLGLHLARGYRLGLQNLD